MEYGKETSGCGGDKETAGRKECAAKVFWAMTAKEILSAYRKEFSFQPGEESENRERYYWLSGFLASVEGGEDDETICSKHGGKVDRLKKSQSEPVVNRKEK